jgi:uncharacterized protein (TIGR00369 family)
MDEQASSIGNSREIVADDGRRYAFADHNCFACGRDNPIGMSLHIELGEGTARTSWTAGDDFVGWSDKLHGGIVATLLDEVMAWACSSFDAWAVTAEMTVRYRSPSAPGEELRAEGRVVERRRRIYEVAGDVRGADGRLVAEATGRYLGASPSAKADLKERYGTAPGVGAE